MNLKKNESKRNTGLLAELFPIELLFVLFWNLALLSKYTDKSNLISVVAGTILLNGLFFFTIARLFLSRNHCFDIKNWLKDNYPFFIICSIFILCYLTVIDAWLNLDGYIYYHCIRQMKNWRFASFSQLMLAGHSSQGYSIFLLIGEFLFPDNVYGVRIVHCMMALITVFCFYKITEAILPKADRLEKLLFTALFAFSPMVMGMTAEINTDFPLLCFFTWMVLCSIKGKKVLQAFCGILLCFSKETGCLLYGFYVLGMVLYRYFKYKRESLKIMLANIFSVDVWLLATGGIMWIANFIWLAVHNSGSWGTNLAADVTNAGRNTGPKINSLGLYADYIFNKLKQMIFINFNWIFYYIILACICFLILKGRKALIDAVKLKGEIYLGILLSFFGFILYNIIYITYNHYRYILPFAFFVSFGIVISLTVLCQRRKLRKLLAAALVLLVLASNFYTFDPFSRLFFMKQGTGTGDILIPCSVSDDLEGNVSLAGNTEYHKTIINGSIYNMQYAYLGKCFDKTLEKIAYTEDTLIILPCEYRDDEYGTLATIFGINLTGINKFYWDTEKKETNINCADNIRAMSANKRYQKINIKAVHNINEIPKKELNRYSKIFYIALPFDKTYNHKEFFGKKQYEEAGEIQYISWKWKLYQISNNKKTTKGIKD